MADLNSDDIERLRQAFAALTDGSVGLSDEQLRLKASTKSAAESSDQFKKSMDAAGKSTSDAFKGLRDNVLSTEKGMQKYAGTLTSATDAISNVSKAFGPLGMAVGLVAKAFGALGGMVLKQNDAMLKAYDDLASVGGAAGLTTRDVLALGAKAGYTSHNLEIFTKHTKSLGTDLLALGNTAAGGMKNFAEMAAVTQEVRDQYNNLGISQEQLTEFQADYVKTMVISGQTLAKSPIQLQQASLKYIDSLNELSAITGLEVKQAQEAQRQAMAQENFNAYIQSKNIERERLREQASREEDPVRKQRLLAEADQISNVIKAKEQFATVAKTTMSAGNALAVLESISGDGAVVYTESNAKLAMAGIDIEKMQENLNQGRKQDVELRAESAQAVRRFNDNFGQGAYAFGKSSRDLQETFGIDNKMRQQQVINEKLLTEEGRKQFEEEQAAAALELELRKKRNDDVKDTQNQQNATELAARKAADQLTNLVSGPINSALQLFGKMVQSLAETVGNILSSWPFNMFSTKKDKVQTKPTEKVSEIQYDAAGNVIGSGTASVSATKPGGPQLSTAKPAGPINPAEFASKLSESGITDKTAQANILAQIRGETGDMTAKGENFNYSGKRIFQLFGEGNKYGNKGRFKSEAEAAEFVKQGPEAIGNLLYGGRLGNAADEGYKYRGRGLIGLTGKDNYARYGKLVGVDLVENPDLANDPEVAQKIAIAYFKLKQKTGTDLTDISSIGKAVGYATGGEETQKRAGYAQEFLSQLQQGANGGIFSGPQSGYPVTLHGNEIVIPDFKLPELAQTLNSVTKQELPVAMSTGGGDSTGAILAMMNMMEEKLDQVIQQLSASNSTQDKILTYSLV